MDPLLAYPMPPDARVVISLRIVAHPHVIGDVSEILANNVEEFCGYLEQHGGTAAPPKLLRSSPLFRTPPKVEVMAGSNQPAVGNVHSVLSNRTPRLSRASVGKGIARSRGPYKMGDWDRKSEHMPVEN